MSDVENAGEQPVSDAALFEQVVSGAPLTSEEATKENADPVNPAEQPKPAEPVAPQAPPETQAEAKPQDQRVPLQELIAARKRAQMAEAMLERFMGQQPAPQQQPAQQPLTLWDDPDAFLAAKQAEWENQQNARMKPVWAELAVIKHGQDKVAEASEAFDALLNAGQLPEHERLQVMGASNPFSAAVQWHQQRQLLQEVNGDPKAYEEKLAAKLLKDPAFLKRAQEAMGQAAQGVQSVFVPAQPSRPAAQPLPSLSRIGAAAPPVKQQQDAESDQELFNSVLAGKRLA